MRSLYRNFTFLVFALALAACSTMPTTPAQSVYAVQSNYAAALTVAVAYKALPPCAQNAPPLCSKLSVVEELQRADNIAHPALRMAQMTVRQPGAGANMATAIFAAEQAVNALAAITSTLITK